MKLGISKWKIVSFSSVSSHNRTSNCNLDSLLQHIHYQFKREEIEYPIIHRINSVFSRATKKWKVLCANFLMFQMGNYCVE